MRGSGKIPQHRSRFYLQFCNFLVGGVFGAGAYAARPVFLLNRVLVFVIPTSAGNDDL
jgi:hypothetical protein